MKSDVAIAYKEGSIYPDKAELFRPGVAYPEYLYNEISMHGNDAYDLVRESLFLLGLDKENFGKPCWNPLGDLIKQGDCVLLKPNLVMHTNPKGHGLDCLVTNPSVVAAAIDYVLIALNGSGKIIVGDAPMQECDFKSLVCELGYEALIKFYKNKNIDIELIDFRNVKTYVDHGLRKLREPAGNKGKIVDVTSISSFNGLSQQHMDNLRITNYDPRILRPHCNIHKHEYKIAEEVLKADVIINLPKPKTHRKAGITACLKNMVGINASKEFLPHHTVEGKSDKGDAYKHRNPMLRISNYLLDKKNICVHENRFFAASLLRCLVVGFRIMGRIVKFEKYSEGSWYGNETIWRTILDLNKILMYADKEGIMRKERQRRVFNICDLVVSGENDGPVNPSRKDVGIICAGYDPVSCDEVVAALMGFEKDKIPTLREARSCTPSIAGSSEYIIVSNSERWDKRHVYELTREDSFAFIPNPGWKETFS